MKKIYNIQLSNFLVLFFIGITISLAYGCVDNNQKQKVDTQIDFEKEKQAILSVLKKSAKAYYEKDLEPWKSTYVQEPYQVRMGYWEGYKNKIQYVVGWDSLYNHKMKTRFNEKVDSEWDESTQDIKNVNMRIFPEIAWVTFEQTSLESGTGRNLGNSLETRILEKKNGEWRIAYLGYMYFPIEKND